PAHSVSVAGHRFGESERRTVLVREQPALTESPQGLELLEREERFAPQMPTVLDAPPTLRYLARELLHEEAEPRLQGHRARDIATGPCVRRQDARAGQPPPGRPGPGRPGAPGTS